MVNDETTNALKKIDQMRLFETGATRDIDTNKYDYEGFLSPLVLRRFGEYMHKHRLQTDGSLRTSDNWQKGIPLDAYVKSAWRHFMDWWSRHRRTQDRELILEALMGLLFNVQGYAHELLKEQEGMGIAVPTAPKPKTVSPKQFPLTPLGEEEIKKALKEYYDKIASKPKKLPDWLQPHEQWKEPERILCRCGQKHGELKW